MLADFTGWEAWVNFPHDHQRLIDLIRRKNANGVVFLSGDIHYAELSKLDVNVPYTLWDLTSSGLTEEWRGPDAERESRERGLRRRQLRVHRHRLAGRGDEAHARHRRRHRQDADVLGARAREPRGVTAMRPVRAVLFDLDGTLVDSEIHTDQSISVVTARHTAFPDFGCRTPTRRAAPGCTSPKGSGSGRRSTRRRTGVADDLLALLE